MFGPKTGLQQGYAKTKMGGCKQAAGANEIQNTRACEKDADCGSKPWNICLFSTSLTSNMPCTDCAIGLYNDVQGITSLSACKKCPKGKYNGEEGAPNENGIKSEPFCRLCPAGFYSSIIAHHVLLANTGRQKR
jgi:hypothetical protein